ncbi:ABC-type molybdate transport system substrate-binding protein [Dyadobacter jejuensis]|uniref:ABC-type molybdate transport system substrate-binding protein n=1 Tax=Dyadobacter jejuensis TaxID=1082580 RepID=A0A316AJC9_9BACT|nr:substrate-binding domain-containing protein [Dyadobacter jejuensis]PWJ57915.1 ABC-type molybdate transport system substrate-binding protein [Dyadobacter jejuensis]
MKNIILSLVLLFSLLHTAGAQNDPHAFDPPWNKPWNDGLSFTVAGVDNVPDLYGDISDPELVVFFAGNQFMVIDDLLVAFKKAYPSYTRIFAETLPPGILAQQIDHGALTMGNMRITLTPDVYTAGKARILEQEKRFSRREVYAKNQLAIMVRKGNPKNIKGLADLSRNDVLVTMPNPEWEGIGKKIEDAYRKVGGGALRKKIMEEKVDDHTTFLTTIHHRQTPMRLLYGASEAGPVWYTEAYYQQMLHHPVEMVKLSEQENIGAEYMAGQLKDAPHPQAAHDFMDFLVSHEAKAIYKHYGFITD